MKNLIIISFLFLICGCSATYKQQRDIKKQHQLNYQYQGELAKDCATLFPAKDSVGKPIYTPAHNIDYSGRVDSLKHYADSVKGALTLLANLPNDTAKLKHTIVLQSGQINTLVNKINDLRAAYKPCKPDTVKVPHFVTDMAKLKVWQDVYNIKADSLAMVKHDLAASKKSGNIYFWILACLSIVIIVTLAIKIYKFIYLGSLKNLI